MPEPIMTAAQISTLLVEEFPQLVSGGHHFVVESVASGHAEVTFETGDHHLRPGGTVSGPSLFALADVAAYVVILAHIGPVISVATANMNMNFLKRPAPGNLRSHSRLIRLGRRLAVVEISIVADGDDEPCAHAVATYALPNIAVS